MNNLFSLYALRKAAKGFVEDKIIAGYFIRAFSAVLREARLRSLFDPREEVAMCFSHHFLQGFCGQFGFAEVREKETEGSSIPRKRFFRASDFLREYLTWNSGGYTFRNRCKRCRNGSWTDRPIHGRKDLDGPGGPFGKRENN
jgi:hypothetical protein